MLGDTYGNVDRLPFTDASCLSPLQGHLEPLAAAVGLEAIQFEVERFQIC